MALPLHDRVAFVTGATSGFGRAIAERFAKDGARVVVTGRRADRLQELARALGERAHAVVLDVRDRRAVEAAVAGLPGPFAEVDVLVNNAGLALGLEPAQRASLDEWDTMIDTNCRGLVTCTRALLPGMVARRRGHVVNIGSVAASYPYPGGNVYGATKAFVHQFSQNLKADLLGTGLRVTVLEPGMADTEFSLVRLKDQGKAKAVYQGMQPLTAEDVAETVAWCVTRPPHFNVNVVEMMPTDQAFSAFSVHRK
ncbi:SDR family NAD(P)-dependent oxidoreductase [Anaeromyxobacter diazotrophicus]|uniref:NAD(P)-dependent oxidoreductase n=1 Tax=Anaeromyxobacter diazotrophicus TaxID=2590199 RepID=A0A7I9VQX0_9BACT|nr:SDR family NAD(P)-dependent oxidoreductase [Anaeromyxobacter diazotrophicus]GEJ58751.1 NAD(P)-dependent oxidoreductase [Anaeromyxobacter diazotrophicus]